MEGTVCIRLFSHPFGMEEEEEEEEPIYASHFLFSTAMCRRLSLSLSIFDNSFSFGSWRGWQQWAEEWAGSCRLRFSLSFNYLPACPSLLLTHHHLPPLYTHTLSFTLLPLFIYQGETSFLSRHSPGDALSLRTFSSPPHYLSFSSSAKLFQLLCFLAIYLTACVCRTLPRV